MRLFRNLSLAALLATGLVAQPASAIEFTQVQAEKSRLTFVFKQMGVSVDGRFRRFPTQLRFDPAKPAAAMAQMDIDLGSVDAGSPEANDEVAGKAWFNTKAFPTARFTASSIKPLGGYNYEIAGKVSIKGNSRDVTAPATVRLEGNTAIIDGALTLKRADFAIGEGMWADFGTVANEIQVKFHLVALAPATKK